MILQQGTLVHVDCADDDQIVAADALVWGQVELPNNVFRSSSRTWSTWDRPGRLIMINRD
jgi:hypothetical protein